MERTRYAIRSVCKNCGVKQMPRVERGTLISQMPCKRCGCYSLVATKGTQLPVPADTLLSVGDAALILGVHTNTIRRLSDRGQLPSSRIDLGNGRRDRRFKKQDVLSLLNRR
jgi:excisionase family DNA binding protein